MFKVNNRNPRTTCEICSQLTVKPLLLTLNIFHPSSSVSTVNFEQINVGWVIWDNTVGENMSTVKIILN